MFDLYESSLKKVEYDKVLSLLADCAGSKEGKRACLNIQPVSDIDEVKTLLQETAFAYEMSMEYGYPAFRDLDDISSILERAQKGGCLQPVEILKVAGVLRCTRNVQAYLDNNANNGVLSLYATILAPNKHFEDSIFNAILSEEEIADTASAELADIRRHMRIQNARIKDSLQKIITSQAYAKYLQESIITIRQGRYVVPVKSEFKNDVPGLVHDVSATGSTYFIEPASAVTANNALRELELQEKKEIERILMLFTAQIAQFSDSLLQNQAALIKLDVIFAKARLANRMNATMPEINDTGRIFLNKARHPLLDPKIAVPISLRLGDDFDAMIITGPNTGGKTVSLKTVGLLTLMAESGMLIPAEEGSVLSVFSAILADIGDEQSIAQSLSTFSSHMRTIVQIVSSCDSRTLVLFDELGAGTDPTEGAALAIALIEFCRKAGSKVLATTHYAELKLYAMRTDGVTNASCEFDVDTLRPTYKLLIGVPGKSNAFAISKKLGLSDDILRNATDMVGQSNKDFEDLLNQLEEQRKQMELSRVEAERLRRETEKIKTENQSINKQLEIEKEKLLMQARAEAKRIIDDARIVANNAVDEIKAIKKQISENMNVEGVNQRQTALRKSLNEAEAKLNAPKRDALRAQPSREIIIGDTVELLKLGTQANVLAINKDGSLLLQAGILKLTAKRDEVYLLENINAYKEKPGRPQHSGREMKIATVASEIDLRGMDSIEAICVLDRYLDEAMRGNWRTVRIIHGKGTGVLRIAVHQSLRKNKFIKSFRLGVYGEGEDGVTIAEFI